MRRSTPSDYPWMLVVDDDKGIRDTLCDILADEGYNVRAAENGARALEMCGTTPGPDLVFLDLQMPVMDGYEFMRVRNSDKVLSRTPICLMTAAGPSTSLPPNATAVLFKPIGLAELMTIVRRFG